MGTNANAILNDNWARFWAVDLHVRMQGSNDAKDEGGATAKDVAQAEPAVNLDASAVTDRNAAVRPRAGDPSPSDVDTHMSGTFR